MPSALRPNLLLRFSHCADPRKVLVNLIIKILAVSDDNERPVTFDLAQNLLRKEHHREAFPASLCMPENTELSMVLTNVFYSFQRAANPEILVVLRNQLNRALVRFTEETEIL